MLSMNGRVINTEGKAVKRTKLPVAVVPNPTRGQGINKTVGNSGQSVDSDFGEVTYNGSMVRNKKFEYSKVDLIAIKKLHDNDSYVKVSIGKYVDLIFKRGYNLGSHNDKAKSYIQQRLRIMAKATKIHFSMLLDELAHNLVLYANLYAKKATMEYSKARKFIPLHNPEIEKPIVGVFPMHPASMYVLRDKNNNIFRYQQRDIASARENIHGVHVIPAIPSSNVMGVTKPGEAKWPEYPADEVMHTYVGKESGYAFGMPDLATVLEDVQALRMMEEHAARLLYRASYPLYHVKVGLPQPGLQGSIEEVDMMKQTISEIPYDGTLITNERVEADIMGAKSEAMDPIPMLNYMEDRSFTGLSVSSVQMGRDTSNRATADALTSEMHDRAEAFQNRLSLFCEDLFDSMLEEGGFDTSDEQNRVFLEWPELELETLIKKEAGIIYKWINNTITADEMRRELGYDALSQEDINNMFFKLVSSELLETKANMTPSPGSSTKSADNKVKPTNQHKKRTGPKRKTESNYIITMEQVIDNMSFSNVNIEEIHNNVSRVHNYMKAIYRKNNSLNENTAKYLANIHEETERYIAIAIHGAYNGSIKDPDGFIKDYLKELTGQVLTLVVQSDILMT